MGRRGAKNPGRYDARRVRFGAIVMNSLSVIFGVLIGIGADSLITIAVGVFIKHNQDAVVDKALEKVPEAIKVAAPDIISAMLPQMLKSISEDKGGE